MRLLSIVLLPLLCSLGAQETSTEPSNSTTVTESSAVSAASTSTASTVVPTTSASEVSNETIVETTTTVPPATTTKFRYFYGTYDELYARDPVLLTKAWNNTNEVRRKDAERRKKAEERQKKEELEREQERARTTARPEPEDAAMVIDEPVNTVTDAAVPNRTTVAVMTTVPTMTVTTTVPVTTTTTAVPLTTRKAASTTAVLTTPVPSTEATVPDTESGAGYPTASLDAMPGAVGPGGFGIAETSDNVLMCSCADAAECRKKASGKVDECMAECTDHLKGFGSNTTAYLGCFKANSASVVEAETCLFNGIENSCSEKTKLIEKTKWDELTSIKYSAKADAAISKTALWKRDEPKYNKVQSFLHCTKNCMHKKLQACVEAKRCDVKLPEVDAFAVSMLNCMKHNAKITKAIFDACQCLAWKNGVTDLRGSCVVIGNQYYIDKA